VVIVSMGHVVGLRFVYQKIAYKIRVRTITAMPKTLVR
jgi:hypothetical protein